MKNIIAVVLILGLVAILLVGFSVGKHEQNETKDFLRIHIRANSNNTADQDIKYRIKDQIVNVLAPVLSNITTKQAAITAVENNLPMIKETADKVLTVNGFSYKSSADIRKENFPQRIYDGVTVNAGVYDALIINLGSGLGDNWWCVIYPPLCFADNTIDGEKGVIYKSKIKEIIEKSLR
jgi:stage II sporulation protein R